MFKSYIKTAWRTLWFNKVTSLISILGLTLGVTCFLLLSTYLINELKYDRFHTNANRIVRINMNNKKAGDAEVNSTAVTPTAPVPVFKQAFSEIEDGVRIYNYAGDGGAAVKYQDKLFSEKRMLLADESFFNIFTFKFLAGDPATALTNPQSVVITASTAQKYFGTENPMGKVLNVKAKRDMIVTGVIEDVPAYSQIKFDMMGTFSMLDIAKTRVWDSANNYSYLLLNPNADATRVEKKINAYLKDLFKDEVKTGNEHSYALEPLTHIHLYSTAKSGLEPSGNSVQVYILAVIAGILLLMACINFLNLATARSADRAHEIGVRKVMGAIRGQLFFQFMMEAAVITFISLLLGALLAALSFGWFSNFSGREVSFTTWNPLLLVAMLVTLFITVTLLAGIYPSVYLSSFKPIKALAKKVSWGTMGMSVRKSLVVVQFVVSVFFVISTLIAGKQLKYIQQKNTGLDRSQVVVINTGGMAFSDIEAFTNQLHNVTGIQQTTASYDSPVDVHGGYSINNAAGKPANFELPVTALPVERNFVPAMGIELIAGSNITAADALQAQTKENDRRIYAFIINETAAKELNWKPAEAIGKKISLNGRQGEVRGVAKDFNFLSLHEQITPVVILPEYDWLGKILIKVSGNNMSQTITGITQSWKIFYPNTPFEYHFLDQEFDALYTTEQRIGSILSIFTFITILISCLGLFGLAVYTTKQRVKEIGIRKILGASVSSILALVASDFLKLVLGAIVIASPAAWYVMHKWLQDFAYRIQIQWWLFAQAAFITLLIALITVGFQSARAALSNPVSSLRSE